MSAHRSRVLVPSALALVIGLGASYVDMHNDEVQAAAIVVFLGAGAVAFWRPRHAWLWGLLCGVGIPLGYCITLIAGTVQREWPQPMIAASLIAVIPGITGAYLGVGARALIMRGSRS